MSNYLKFVLIMIGIWLFVISAYFLALFYFFRKPKPTDPKYELIVAEEDGWQEDTRQPHLLAWDFIWSHKLVVILISLLILLPILYGPHFFPDRTSANHTAPKSACITIIHEVQYAQKSLGRIPTFQELSQYIDPGVYNHMYLPGCAPVYPYGYKAYQFRYLETTDGKTPHPIFRAVVAHPVVYDKGGRNAYYCTSESDTIFQCNSKDVKIPDVVISIANLSSTWIAK